MTQQELDIREFFDTLPPDIQNLLITNFGLLSRICSELYAQRILEKFQLKTKEKTQC